MTIILEMIYSFVGSLGFAILFNVRGKSLYYASAGGAIGWFIYRLLSMYNITSSATAIFLATICISVYAEIMARIEKQPVTVFIIAAMIPLVPGSGMFYTTYEAVKGNLSASLHTGLKTLYDAGFIATGIILVSTVSRILKQTKNYTNIKHKNK
ncbi:Uncharacterized membrane protein YjjB, DUF3815 family [Hathewaya proteolytica DSM 3090]|uniref:Uncharacterized membrane protein YjjB, DUF3815 family n=1 Tax=Hathewaya proteolytica DSM 3090 TaxID=1121331 RepID=A0A1M6P7A9_9CLOT|nr:threonine/serine exporter family protein [Hathewaya proteolytica]SHK03887.1 Uncharacterized membrane protein YjjB, DUF3815 family [Hathewaya proteolytica DSM 3090]